MSRATLIEAATPVPAAARAVWIDRLRVVLTVLVIVHHAAITYGASGSWFLKVAEATSVPLTFLAAVNQAFFMGLFFMLSGALAPGSLIRKGRAGFLADRAVRLGVPVLAFGFLLGPLTVALAQAPWRAVLPEAAARIAGGAFVLGPLWFPAALLAFSAALVLLPIPAMRRMPVPPFRAWLAVALATGLLALLIRQVVPVGQTVWGFQPGYFASYIVLFAIGVRAGVRGWLTALPHAALRRAMLTGLAALPLLPAVLLSIEAPRYETGLSLAAIAYAVWEPLVALGAIAALLHWSQRGGAGAAALWAWGAANSYGAFILHAPLLVAASRVLDGWGVTGGAALGLAVAATVSGAFGLTALLRRSALVARAI